MEIIVQKFGGTSVGSIERIRNVANLVKTEYDKGNKVAVVVSAMSGVTDQLVNYAKSVSELQNQDNLAEYDAIIASGEQVTSGLLSLTLQSMGLKSRSWHGWQLGIKTDPIHSNAKIEKIEVESVLSSLLDNEIPIIAGFQGVSNNRITTLGRGGSDTSAVALAAALHASRCDIYTDVDGVYTCDPRIVKKARKLDKVTFEEMLEMASLGAKVLHSRCVEIALKNKVPLRVLSSFNPMEGTWIVNESEIMESRIITGLTYNRNEAMIALKKIKDTTSMQAKVFSPIAEAGINVDMIVQNIGELRGKDYHENDITFTIPKSDLKKAISILEEKKEELGYSELIYDENVTKVSVIGVGMRSHSGIAQEMFQTLADKNIKIIIISTSEIKISVLIPDEHTELALRSLHTVYGLDQEEER